MQRHGEDESVRTLFELGANVITADQRGWTPLHIAAFEGHAKTISTLASLGGHTHINAATAAHEDAHAAPIQLAGHNHHLDAIKALILLGSTTPPSVYLRSADSQPDQPSPEIPPLIAWLTTELDDHDFFVQHIVIRGICGPTALDVPGQKSSPLTLLNGLRRVYAMLAELLGVRFGAEAARLRATFTGLAEI